MIVFLYLNDKISKVEVEKEDFHKIPNGIIKIYDNNVEYYGWASYGVLGDKIIGIHQINTKEHLENLGIVLPKNFKYGAEIPDVKWKEFHNKGIEILNDY